LTCRLRIGTHLLGHPLRLTPFPRSLQTLYKNSAPGECYVVDSEVITSGIPYQDYFYTVHRYCLTSINKNKSRLRYTYFHQLLTSSLCTSCLSRSNIGCLN
jgi:hypothetical protein